MILERDSTLENDDSLLLIPSCSYPWSTARLESTGDPWGDELMGLLTSLYRSFSDYNIIVISSP